MTYVCCCSVFLATPTGQAVGAWSYVHRTYTTARTLGFGVPRVGRKRPLCINHEKKKNHGQAVGARASGARPTLKRQGEGQTQRSSFKVLYLRGPLWTERTKREECLDEVSRSQPSTTKRIGYRQRQRPTGPTRDQRSDHTSTECACGTYKIHARSAAAGTARTGHRQTAATAA